MRFSTIIVSAALATLSVAQSSSSANSTASASSVSASLVPASTYSLTPAQSSQANCLASCRADDPNCRAKCIVVNEGDYSQQNRTIDCISECPKGNGTATDNLTFENCQKGCIASASILPATTQATNTATKGSNSAAATGTGAGASGSSGSGSGSAGSGQASKTSGSSGSATGSAAASTSSGSAADNVHIPIIGAFIGLGSLAVMFGL